MSWYGLVRHADECVERFGRHLSLPLVDLSVEVRRRVARSTRLLDVGAGVEKRWQQIAPPPAQYFSMDIDPMGRFDYRTFADVPPEASFELILMNQVLEHLTVRAAARLVREAAVHLAPGGHVVATVPNSLHPVRQWGDPTHLTAWAAEELYALFRSSGYEVVQLARYSKKPPERNWLRRFIVNVVCTQFRMDWADSVLLVARWDATQAPCERSKEEHSS